MATHTKLAVTPRATLGKHLNALRRQGIIPGNIFGHGPSTTVQFDEHTFERLRELHQTTGVIELEIVGQSQPETVLVRHIQHRPSTGKIQHVDFLRVAMNQLIKAKVPLKLNGEPPVVKTENAVVYFLQEALEIEAVPDDLPESIAIDVALLTALDSVVHASDVKLPAGVKLAGSGTDVLVRVQHSRTEAAEPAEPAATKPEGAASS